MDLVRFSWLLNNIMKITVDQVKELNSKGEYPELDHSMLKKYGYTIQLEAG